MGHILGSLNSARTTLLLALFYLGIGPAASQNTAVIPAPETPRIWAQRWQEKLARVKQGNIDLIFVGDSISHAWDSPENQARSGPHARPAAPERRRQPQVGPGNGAGSVQAHEARGLARLRRLALRLTPLPHLRRAV